MTAEWTPTKITLEVVPTASHLRKYSETSARLWVACPQTKNGILVLEQVPLVTGKSIAGLRKQATKYAKQWNIPFLVKIEG